MSLQSLISLQSLAGSKRWLALVALFLATLLQASASPYYSVAERDNVWWFIAPDGEPFFSLGPTCIDPGGKSPDDKRPNEYHYSDHYDSREAWAEDTLRRLGAWNFNTIAGWSSELLNGKGMPDAPVLHLGVSAGVQWDDLFGDDVVHQAERLAETMVAPRSGDPNLLGWFTDNELGWYAETTFIAYLRFDSENKTRQKLIALLRDRYGDDPTALANDFIVPGVATFDEFKELHLRPGGMGREVVHAFMELVAGRYYEIMHDAIRKYDTNHLILGDRYNGYYPLAAARAAAPYVDVISTNASFAETSDGTLFPFFMQTLHRITGKPVLMSEYYSAAMENQSGNKNSSTHAFTTVDTQVERTLVFENSLRHMLDAPYVIGAHWFQFNDEPPHGRGGDGEDFNFGLVDIHNEPYTLLMNSMTALNAQAETLHAQANDWPSTTTVEVPGAPSNPFTGLFAWNKAQGYVPYASELAFGDMLVCADSNFLYLGLRAEDFIDSGIYADKRVPPEDAMAWRIALGDGEMQTTVRFGTKLASSCDNEAVRVRHHDGGIRQRVIAAFPRAALPLDNNRSIRLQCEAEGYARYMKMTWDATLILPSQ